MAKTVTLLRRKVPRALVMVSLLLVILQDTTALMVPNSMQRKQHKPNPLRPTITNDASACNNNSNNNNKSIFRQSLLPIVLAASLALPAHATTTVNSAVYTHDYADPLHPQCQRHIQVDSGSNTFRYWGTAVGPQNDVVLRGCSPQEIHDYGIRRGKFSGVVTADGRLSAGDGVHEGVWEPAGSLADASSSSSNLKNTNVDGIRWNDGNKWIVEETGKGPKLVGQVIFYSYLGLSTLAGIKGLYDGIQRKRRQASE